MKALSRAATTAVVVVALAAPAWAGQVKIEIRAGQVTLSAKDATVREILAEWARVGQTRIVNAERVGGGLVTLELSGVPEAKALDIVLRSVAGYVAAPRVLPVVAETSQSRYDRIMIMAIPRPPAGGASPVTPPPPTSYEPRNRMGYQPQPSLMVDDQDEPVVQPNPQPQPVYGMPGGAAQPGMTVTTPAMPVGGVSAPQPGMATPMPLPQQQQPPQPVAPGAVPPTIAAPRPGVLTAPPKPPGAPGGPGGN